MMKTAGKLVVLGSINADHILNLDAFPTPGETVTGHHYQVAFGGKGANQAVAAGRSGADIAFIACTGVTISVNASVVSWRAIKSTWRPCARLPGKRPGWR